MLPHKICFNINIRKNEETKEDFYDVIPLILLDALFQINFEGSRITIIIIIIVVDEDNQYEDDTDWKDDDMVLIDMH